MVREWSVGSSSGFVARVVTTRAKIARWGRRGIVLCALAATIGAGCGGGSDGDDGSAGPVTVDVGVLPIAAVAPLYIGIDQGFFEAEGLNVEPHILSGGAAVVPAVISGDLAFGYSNTASILLAAGKGLPLRIIAEGNQTHSGPDANPDTLIVDADKISTPRDLEGERVAVNTLGGLTELAVRVALEKLDVDTTKVTFVEVDFPDMQTALDSERVVAAKMNEPFVTPALASGGMRALTHPFYATLGPGAGVSQYFTSAEYAESHPEVVASFKKAMNRALEYAAAHEDQVRKIVPTYTKVPPDVARTMQLDAFTSKLNRGAIEKLSDLMVEYDLLETPPDVDQLLSGAS